ncbi:DUF59 domain-containing protein [Rhizobium ruizarguesonis]|nr:iron-sulfur cluster assembly protein [Rhizobium ruizarguesonis]TAX63547.1 DUF59 domain-containing protein [Rhizobium ruizarguesonis]
MSGALLDLLVAVAGALILIELDARIDAITTWIIYRALSLLRLDLREDLQREWTSITSEQPTSFSKLVVSVGFLVTGVRIGIIDGVYDRLAQFVGERRYGDDVRAALKTVYDPEIPADIYELGFIPSVKYSGRSVTITDPPAPANAH